MSQVPATYTQGSLSEAERKDLWSRLTALQQSWLIEFLANGGNATQAAKDAGYSANSDQAFRVIGHQNRHHDRIGALIADAFAAKVMSADEALWRVSKLAEADMSDFLTFDEEGEPVLDLSQAAARGVLHLIKDLDLERIEEVDDDGTATVTTKAKIKLHDPQKALETILKAQGVYDDEDASGQGQVTNNFFVQLNDQLKINSD